MEDSRGEIAFPTIDEICHANRLLVDATGGLFVPPDNMANRGALEYVLDEIEQHVYDRELHPSLKQKAAAIVHHIISRHIFWDGNKRTAFHVGWMFLNANGVPLYLDSSLVELSESVAAGSAGYDELLAWLHGHQRH